MAFRKFLFQLHLWVGLILGVVFVLLGLSGSIGLLRPLLTPIPVVQAVVLVLAVIYVALTMVSDLMNAVLDPRLRA